MAYKNKTQLAATITALAATVDLETHDKPQRSEIVESLLCLLDRETTVNSATSATLAIDFTNYDLIKSTLSAGTLTITYNITGLQTGDIKFLWVSKLGGDTIVFNGVNSLIEDADYFNAYIGDVLFMIIKKSGDGSAYMFPLKMMGNYLKVSANGSDIDDVATFRSNLGVYSTSEAQAALTDVGWTACTRVASQVDSSTFNVNAAMFGKMATCTGKIKINSAPGTAVLFTLPGTVGVSSIDVPFVTGDAGASNNVNELYLEANTRNVKSYGYSNDRESVFSFSYYVW